MGRLIEQQAVIDCLTNTAKYYEREDADEWTKGIHYGLLHGVDNILDNVPIVEAIPKADYETRLKADMVAMLTDIQLEFKEGLRCKGCCNNCVNACEDIPAGWFLDFIDAKINSLKENADVL